MWRLDWMQNLRLWLLIGLTGAVTWLIFLVWTPSGSLESSICFFRRTTHIECPGCGMTRSLAALAKGNLIEAVTYHPMGPLLALQAAVTWLAWGLVAFRIVAAPHAGLLNWTLGGNGLLLLIVWAVRLF